MRLIDERKKKTMLLYIDMKNYKNITCTDFVNGNSFKLELEL